MKYIDAGYAAALGALFVYGASLLYRRRRLERTVPDAAAAEPTRRSVGR